MFFFEKKQVPLPEPQPEPLLEPLPPFEPLGGQISYEPIGGYMAPTEPESFAVPFLELSPIFQQPENVPLMPRTTSIGRAATCTIVIPAANIPGSSNSNLPRLASRRHCELRCTQGSVEIRDTDSTHGTYLNGVRLQSGIWTFVPDNSEVWLARPEIKFTVHYNSAEKPDPSGTDDGFVRVDR